MNPQKLECCKAARLVSLPILLLTLVLTPLAASGAATFAPTGSLHTARFFHTATLLPSGEVLVAGGSDVNGSPLASAELYNPAKGAWSAAGSMAAGRGEGFTATLLPNGIGPKTFEQAAGFLRIRNGDNPLDMTAVHPESYAVVEQIATALNTGVAELIRRPELLDKVDRSRLSAGAYTLDDIIAELRKPGGDPRDKFVAPQFREEVREIADVQVGMVLEGRVTNVTKFGAFVDIGVHQDGLVHVSELSDKFIKDPAEAVKTGQIVKMKVLNVDAKTMRIGLSIKALAPPRALPQPKKPAPNAPATFDQKLAALSAKWTGRC